MWSAAPRALVDIVILEIDAPGRQRGIADRGIGAQRAAAGAAGPAERWQQSQQEHGGSTRRAGGKALHGNHPTKSLNLKGRRTGTQRESPRVPVCPVRLNRDSVRAVRAA